MGHPVTILTEPLRCFRDHSFVLAYDGREQWQDFNACHFNLLQPYVGNFKDELITKTNERRKASRIFSGRKDVICLVCNSCLAAGTKTNMSNLVNRSHHCIKNQSRHLTDSSRGAPYLFAFSKGRRINAGALSGEGISVSVS